MVPYKRVVLAGLVFALVVLGTPRAEAGGSPLELDRTAYVSGDTATAYTTYGRGCCDRGDASDGPYFLYLLPGGDHGGVPPLPGDAILLAEGQTDGESGLGSITFTFTVPDLEPATYDTAHCNDPCTKQLGDVMDTVLTIVEDPGEARLLGRIASVERKTWNLAPQNWVSRQIRSLRKRTDARVEALELRVQQMERRDRELSKELTASKEGPGAAAFVPVSVLVALALLARPLLTRRRDETF